MGTGSRMLSCAAEARVEGRSHSHHPSHHQQGDGRVRVKVESVLGRFTPNTGTSTYARKSWGGLPRCDLAPQSTSFGTVALRERQHLAMADTTFHSKPPRIVPHVPTTTFHTGAVCSRRQTHGPVVCRKCVNGYSYAVRQVHVAWLRGYVGFTMFWPHCLCRPFHTRYFPVGHVAIYRCLAFANLDP